MPKSLSHCPLKNNIYWHPLQPVAIPPSSMVELFPFSEESCPLLLHIKLNENTDSSQNNFNSDKKQNSVFLFFFCWFVFFFERCSYFLPRALILLTKRPILIKAKQKIKNEVVESRPPDFRVTGQWRIFPFFFIFVTTFVCVCVCCNWWWAAADDSRKWKQNLFLCRLVSQFAFGLRVKFDYVYVGCKFVNTRLFFFLI